MYHLVCLGCLMDPAGFQREFGDVSKALVHDLTEALVAAWNDKATALDQHSLTFLVCETRRPH